MSLFLKRKKEKKKRDIRGRVGRAYIEAGDDPNGVSPNDSQRLPIPLLPQKAKAV